MGMLKRVLTLSVVLVTLSVAFNNCSKVSFQQGSEKPALSNNIGSSIDVPGDDDDKKDDGPILIYEASANARNAALPIDMIWMIDNSGSMVDTAQAVRDNFQNFANQVAAVPDMKLALVSKIGTTGTSTNIPSSVSIPHIEINQSVDSTNGLDILSSALCPTSAVAGSPCASVTNHPLVRGKLNNFLRPDSHKVFVLVTDDESKLKSGDFLTRFDSIYPNGALTVYGFIGLGEVSPCQAKTGTQYIDLAAATGGQMYNICDTDWSTKYAQLADNVVQLGINNIALPAEVVHGTIVSVKVNGVTIKSSQYTITSSGIILDHSLTENINTVHLKIEYRK